MAAGSRPALASTLLEDGAPTYLPPFTCQHRTQRHLTKLQTNPGTLLHTHGFQTGWEFWDNWPELDMLADSGQVSEYVPMFLGEIAFLLLPVHKVNVLHLFVVANCMHQLSRIPWFLCSAGIILPLSSHASHHGGHLCLRRFQELECTG